MGIRADGKTAVDECPAASRESICVVCVHRLASAQKSLLRDAARSRCRVGDAPRCEKHGCRVPGVCSGCGGVRIIRFERRRAGVSEDGVHEVGLGRGASGDIMGGDVTLLGIHRQQGGDLGDGGGVAGKYRLRRVGVRRGKQGSQGMNELLVRSVEQGWDGRRAVLLQRLGHGAQIIQLVNCAVKNKCGTCAGQWRLPAVALTRPPDAIGMHARRRGQLGRAIGQRAVKKSTERRGPHARRTAASPATGCGPSCPRSSGSAEGLHRPSWGSPVSGGMQPHDPGRGETAHLTSDGISLTSRRAFAACRLPDEGGVTPGA